VIGPSHDALVAFRSWIAERGGLWFEDARLERLREVVIGRATALRLPCDEYVARLGAHPQPEVELKALAADLTVAETHFFRHEEQLRAFAAIASGRRAAGGAPLRVLSAGCSTGEEPYTLAMILADAAPAAAPVLVDAVDLDPRALARAQAARYSPWALRATSADARARWFRGDGGQFVLDPAIVRRVRFTCQNLASEADGVLAPGAFDVVFCRNVLMYFTPAAAQRVVARLARALAPGGLLFLGHAETLRGLSDAFALRQRGGAFFYERRGGHAAKAPPRVAADSMLDAVAASAAAILGSAQRIDELARASSPPPSAVAARPAPAPSIPDAMLDLLREERWRDAEALLDRLPDRDRSSPEATLLRAVFAAHEGDLAAAESRCAELLDGSQRAGAHHLLGLCCESAGDRDGAVHHHEAASRLDPTFALPRLHLGLLARRMGDGAAAQRALADALALLDGEDGARLVLFAGGLGRDALRKLCRAELTEAGGAA
jgi:chemotaxis protein methyltransferase CheR